MSSFSMVLNKFYGLLQTGLLDQPSIKKKCYESFIYQSFKFINKHILNKTIKRKKY